MKGEEAVSPVLGELFMVVIVVVLSAFLFYDASTFTQQPASPTTFGSIGYQEYPAPLSEQTTDPLLVLNLRSIPVGFIDLSDVKVLVSTDGESYESAVISPSDGLWGVGRGVLIWERYADQVHEGYLFFRVVYGNAVLLEGHVYAY
jgi:FlaG/FlaF family flagellin (archaellin)